MTCLLVVFMRIVLPGVSILVCFSDLIAMSLRKGCVHVYATWCVEVQSDSVFLFAFSAQSAAGFPAFQVEEKLLLW